MLHRKHFGERICITQPTRAWVAGQLARAWGNDRFGSFAPWEEVCLGAEQHDMAGINGKAHRHSIPQPAILTALLNFQQQ